MKWKNTIIPIEQVESGENLPTTGVRIAHWEEVKNHSRNGYLRLNLYHAINSKNQKGFYATISTLGHSEYTDFIVGTDSTTYKTVLNAGKNLVESEYQRLFKTGRWRV